MGRSLGFGSTTCDKRPIQTRFRYGYSAEQINQATDGNSPVHYAKGTQSLVPSPKRRHRAPTAGKYMVSGTFYSPRRGAFHRSIALLFAIGRQVVLSLRGWAPWLHAEFHELRATLENRS